MRNPSLRRSTTTFPTRSRACRCETCSRPSAMRSEKMKAGFAAGLVVSRGRRSSHRPGMHQSSPTWGMLAVLSPEQNQPTRVPQRTFWGMRLAGSEKFDWLVTALLHEALHLPGVRGPGRSKRGLRCRGNARSRSVHGLAERCANVKISTSNVREGLDRCVKSPSLDQNGTPSGSPVHRCHAPFEAICRSIRNRSREEKGIDPWFSL